MDSGRGRRDRPAGLPHSETHGSRAACASPWNIAACRVLRRHPLPRHPSCARKAWPQNLFARPRLRTSDAPAGSTAPSGRGLPLLHSIYLQSLFLSFASGCQRAFPKGGTPREPGGAIQAEHRPRPELAGLPLKKEVIQPLVPQRLPCYDFIPVTNRSLGASLHCWLSQRLRVQSAPMM